MPFTGADDPDLPSNVQGLPTDRRAQWVEVFNSVFVRCTRIGGDESVCEGDAIRQANGVVKMATLKTRELTDVEILRPGNFHGQGCPPEGCPFTVEMFGDMVEAQTELAGKFDAPVKLGHDDDQKLVQEDGFPSAGWIKSLRLNGEVLMADLTQVPEKVAQLIDAGAYRKRSAEVAPNLEIDGRKFKWVVTGLALLGADLPAVDSLDDIRALYQKVDLKLADNVTPAFFDFGVPDPPTVDLASVKTRLRELREAARALVKGKKGSPVLDALFRDLQEGIERIVSPKPEKMNRTDLAVWTGAFINDLPDTAFALVEAGGEKDEDGRTTPRSLRHLPHHGTDGLDLPHLRNALGLDEENVLKLWPEEAQELSRLPQSKLSPALRRRALAHLQAHAREEDVGDENRQAIVEAIGKLQEAAMAMDEKAIRELLKLDEKADVAAAVRKLHEQAAKGGGNGNTPESVEEVRSELTKTQADVLKLQTVNLTAEIDGVVDGAITTGRLLPAQRENARKMAATDLAAFKVFIEQQPEGLIKLGEIGTADDAAIAGLEPTVDEIQVAKDAGVWSPAHRITLMRSKAADKGIELPEGWGEKKKDGD